MAIPQLAIITDNMYLDVIHRLHEALRMLTLTGADSMATLSETPVLNIELAPVILATVDPGNSPSIYISVDS